MKHLTKLLSVLSLFLLASCKEELPAPTQSGANIIACKVNGKNWVADASYGFNMKKFSLGYSYLYPPHKRLVLNASRVTKDENSRIQLALEDVRGIGTHSFSFDTGSWPDYMKFKNHAMYKEYRPGEEEYMTNSRHTGAITFTRVDTVNKIIAGTFAFTAESLDGSGQTVRVTDGRFDINYGQQ